ncbi:tetratricopeptide repeat protein [Terrisporobacter sp.]
MEIDFELIRHSKGITRSKLAKMAGIPTKTLYNIEKGKTISRKDTFELIKEALEVSFSYEDYYIYMKGKKKVITKSDMVKRNEQINKKIILAKKLYNEGKYEDALRIYESLAFLCEEEEHMFSCALTLQMLERYEDSIKYCEKLICGSSLSMEAIEVMAESLAMLYRSDEALKNFEKVIEEEESGEVYYNMGVCYHYKNDFDSAISYYEKSIELIPNFFSAYYNMALCYYKKKDIEKAMKYIKKAIAIDHKREEPYDVLERCYQAALN